MDEPAREGRVEAPPSRHIGGVGFWFRVAGVAVVDALAVWAFPTLYETGNWLLVALLVIGVVGINVVFFSRRAYPLRYLLPGLVFLVLFMLYPIGYTVYLTTTNFQIGNIGNKQQAIRQLVTQRYIVPEAAETLRLEVYGDERNLRFLTISPSGEACQGLPRAKTDPPGEAVACVSGFAGDPPAEIEGLALIPSLQRFRLSALTDLVLDLPDGQAQVVTTSSAVLAIPRYSYDPSRDVLVDNQEERTCPASEGNFVCDGQSISPGWREIIGFDNYLSVVTDARVRAPLFRVFSWNIVYAVLVVGLQLAIGLGLALTFQDKRLRLRRSFRSLLVLPYAVPAFISVLVWRGLLDDQFGKVNDLLSGVGIGDVPWLTNGWAAKAAVILVTVWSGFPYMMLVCMGALQAIPIELTEAARVDGAPPMTAFRRVTFPLLMVIIAPLLIASFAFNFNNFVNIFLLTGGGPAVFGYNVPVGDTMLLINFTYTLATGGGGRYALAATFSIFIFIIVAIISITSFRYTRRLEEVYGNL